MSTIKVAAGIFLLYAITRDESNPIKDLFDSLLNQAGIKPGNITLPVIIAPGTVASGGGNVPSTKPGTAPGTSSGYPKPTPIKTTPITELQIHQDYSQWNFFEYAPGEQPLKQVAGLRGLPKLAY